MHGFIALLVVGVIALIVWVVKTPDRKKQKQAYNKFSKDFKEWNRR